MMDCQSCFSPDCVCARYKKAKADYERYSTYIKLMESISKMRDVSKDIKYKWKPDGKSVTNVVLGHVYTDERCFYLVGYANVSRVPFNTDMIIYISGGFLSSVIFYGGQEGNIKEEKLT